MCDLGIEHNDWINWSDPGLGWTNILDSRVAEYAPSMLQGSLRDWAYRTHFGRLVVRDALSEQCKTT